MKEIITSDWHLGQLSDSFIEENGQERSVNETVKQFDNILNYAVINKIKRIFIAGDIFENKNPIAKYNELFNVWLKYTNRLGIEVIINSGNHDANNSGSSATSPIKEMNFDNVKVFDEDVSSINEKKVNYILIPHLTKNQLKLENIKDYEKEWENRCEEDCAGGKHGRPPIFWGIIVILFGLWILFEFVLKNHRVIL